MKHILKNIFFLLFLFLTHSNYARFLNAIILLDDGNESISTNGGSLTDELSQAIQQQAAPIIASKNIFEAFFYGRKKIADPIIKQNYNNVTFVEQDWDIYQNNYFYLLIPQKYKQKVAQNATNITAINGYTQEEIIIGFQIDPQKRIVTKTSIDQISKQSESTQYPPVDINKLKELFVKGRNGSIFGTWLFSVGGHGKYYSEQMRIQEQEPGLEENLLKEADTSLRIAGMNLKQFRDFLQFLTTTINTKFLYYLTCYGGGLNLILPFIRNVRNEEGKGKIIAGINPNFIIVSAALTEIKGFSDIGQINFLNFFTELQKYFEGIPIETSKNTPLENHPLKKILKYVVPLVPTKRDPYGLSSTPSIKFPNIDTFLPIPTSNKIFVLSKVLATKSKLENKPIEIKNKQAILVYPAEIDVPVKIIIDDPNIDPPALVSIVPGIAFHFFKKIEPIKFSMNIFLDDFVQYIIGTIQGRIRKYFIIDELKVANVGKKFGLPKQLEQISLYDVFIINGEKIITMILSLNNNNKREMYYGKWEKLKKTEPIVFEKVDEEPLVPKEKNFSTLLKNLIENVTAQNVGELYVNYPVLADIIKEYIFTDIIKKNITTLESNFLKPYLNLIKNDKKAVLKALKNFGSADIQMAMNLIVWSFDERKILTKKDILDLLTYYKAKFPDTNIADNLQQLMQ